MTKIVIYGTGYCSYCEAAKELLTRKNVNFDDVRIDENTDKREEMMRLGGGRTVPQIFIDDKLIGGFDDLSALDQSGELDKLLTEEK